MILVSVLASACSDPVTVAAPSPAPPAAAPCRKLVDHLPDQVGGQSARSVQPAGALAGAWGDPPIVLRCGVPKPAALGADSACFVINGVGWFAEQDGRPVSGMAPITSEIVFTTVGRSPYVEVSVPPYYQPASDALVDLTAAVKRATSKQQPCV